MKAIEPSPLYVPDEIFDIKLDPHFEDEEEDIINYFRHMESQPEQTNCIDLQSVHFRNADFRNPRTSKVVVSKELEMCMQHRQRRLMTIRYLIFTGCSGLSEELLDELRNTSEWLEVDGDVTMLTR